MKNQAKLILNLSAILVTLSAAALIMGVPSSVEAGMVAGYNSWAAGFGFLSLLTLGNALWCQIQPHSLWNKCAGLALPAGTFVLGASNFLYFTGHGFLPAVIILGYLVLVTGVLCFLASAVLAKSS